jgi:sugar phosphate isomerase/epimerase
MGNDKIKFSVFTKPWKQMAIPELGEFVHRLGFDGIELPVRPGFQVEPENVGRDLPKAAEQLATFDVKIMSVAGPTDAATIAACAEAKVPIIRTMVRIGQEEDYLAAVERVQKDYDALLPLLEQYGVTIGVQNHCGRFVCNAMGLHHLMKKYNPNHVAAVWDAAHNALSGEEPELAIDIIWSHLAMVNLKSGFWRRANGPEAEDVQWKHYWTNGRQGLVSWPRVAETLKQRGYEGPICLTAEYSDKSAVNRLVVEDFAFAKSLFK